jgi:hypothetical protein
MGKKTTPITQKAKGSPFKQNDKPKHGQTYSDYWSTRGGATGKWGQPERDQRVLNMVYSDSSSQFVNKKFVDLNKEKLNTARQGKKIEITKELLDKGAIIN